jgi:hypothetical protein
MKAAAGGCDHVHGYSFEIFTKPTLTFKMGAKLRSANEINNSWRNATRNINAASRIKRERFPQRKPEKRRRYLAPRPLSCIHHEVRFSLFAWHSAVWFPFCLKSRLREDIFQAGAGNGSLGGGMAKPLTQMLNDLVLPIARCC